MFASQATWPDVVMFLGLLMFVVFVATADSDDD